MAVVCPKCRTENTQDSRFCKSCATPLPGTLERSASLTRTLERPAQELSPGSLFAGRFQVIEDLGQGGMGHVYKALDTRTGEKIALKVLRPGLEADGRSLERFGHELTSARRISHRNVCRMFDLGEDAGRLYITMEFVPGEDLKSILRMMGAMSPSQALNIAAQICDGLEEAHRLGVVHRDLKPANVLVDREGHARIMDFGIARSGLSRGITDTGTMIGTPDYMSPEQAEGRDTDARSDLYSFGVMLFEMTTGRLPFDGDSPLAVALKHKTEPPPDPRAVVPGLPADLARIILRCLEKDRSKRYQSAADLRTDLEAAAAALPGGSRVLPRRGPLTSREITVKLPLKKLVWPGVALAVLAAAAIFLLPLLRKGGTGAAAPKIPGSVAIVAFDNSTGDARYDYLRKVIPNLLITNLENTGLFQVATWERMRDVLSQTGRKGIDIVDPDSGFDFCRREGVASIVVGSFTRAGDTFVTEFKLLDAETRRLVGTSAARGTGEDSILNVHIDELSRRIAEGLGAGKNRLDSTRLSVADLTTGSTEAYKAYLQGQEELSRFDDLAARKEFEEAIRLDPQFAIAYLGLGLTLEREGDLDKVKQAYSKAKELSARAPEKERLQIEARYALRVERDAPKAIALMKETVARYPREKELHRTLGTLLIGRDPDTAIAEFQAALSLDPDYGVVHNELAFALVAKDDYAGAQAHLERYAALAPGEFNPFDSLGLVLFLRGRLDEARANFEKAGAINPRLGEEGPVAYILALQEDFDGAIDLLDRFAANVWADGPRSEGPAWQGVFLYVTGRRRAAFERLESGLRLAVSSHSNVREGAIHLIRGFLRADMGEIDRAREDFRSARTVLEPLGSAPRLAWRTGFIYSDIRAGAFEDADKGMAEIDKMAPAEARSPMLAATLRYYRFLTFAGRGESEEAFREAEGPRPYQVPMSWNFNIPSLAAGNLPVTMDEVAQARARAGLLDEAIEEYRALMTVSPETHLRRLINPLYHFRVAGLYEKKGVRSEAVRHYRRFLELWKDADPELPEPGMARERLAALER